MSACTLFLIDISFESAAPTADTGPTPPPHSPAGRRAHPHKLHNQNQDEMPQEDRNRQETRREQHRLTIGSCERCGEIACQCCMILCAMIILTSMTIALIGQQSMPSSNDLSNLKIDEYGYEDPRHGKSPYSSLAKAMHKYVTWHSELPKYVTFEFMDATNLQIACINIKKECLNNQTVRSIVNIP